MVSRSSGVCMVKMSNVVRVVNINFMLFSPGTIGFRSILNSFKHHNIVKILLPSFTYIQPTTPLATMLLNFRLWHSRFYYLTDR